MTRPFFYFARLNLWNVIYLLAYFVCTAIVGYYIHSGNTSVCLDVLPMYATLTQFMVYVFGYSALRNLGIYLIWILISFIHLYWYLQLRDNIDLQQVRGHAATALRDTLPLLLLFQVLRFISIKTQGMELIAPVKGGGLDEHDGRKTSFIDFVLFVVYFAAVIWGAVQE